jgi:tetratricopeptide (TPR) repeat protein
MNASLIFGAFFVLLPSFASGQPALSNANANGFNEELKRQIVLQEATVQRVESAHTSSVVLSRAYERLALLYENAARLEQSERVLERAVSLLRPAAEPREDLAVALSQLGNLHISMGKLRESEKESREALDLWQGLGDRLQIARNWNDLAALFLMQNKFERARDLARQAMNEFETDEHAGVLDRISARFALSRALCAMKDFASAIPLLKTALGEAKAKLPPNDFPVGLGNFLLGYAYWKSGDMSRANEYLERGTALMSVQLGWGHPGYLRALQCYAEFLREDRNVEAANVVEGRIRQAEAVVDVHALQNGQGALGFAGLK